MYCKEFSEISRFDNPIAGGKGASLGEMTQAGIPVPGGFVVLAESFEQFIDENNVRIEIDDIIQKIDHSAVFSIESASEKIQTLILGGEIPKKIQQEITTYHKKLGARFCAVRSSATAEDGSEHAWAGQLDTYLNVSESDILKYVQSCWASLFTPRALFYRTEKGLHRTHISVAVVVQEMIEAESAGVAFSVHPVTENHDEMVIEGSWGLGEAVVSGEVTPDSFVVSKSTGKILSEHIAEKKKGIFRNKDGGNEWIEIQGVKREQSVLSRAKTTELSQLIIQIEQHYGFPCDIEWALANEKIHILQARPITTLSGDAKKMKHDIIIGGIKQFHWEPWLQRSWYAFLLSFSERSFSQENIHRAGFTELQMDAILFQEGKWYSSQQVFDNMDIYIEKYFTSHDMFDLNNQLTIFFEESKKKINDLSLSNISLQEKFESVYSILSTAMTFIWIAHSVESYYNKKIALEVPKYVKQDIDVFVGDASFPQKKNLHMILDDMILQGKESQDIVKEAGWVKIRDGFSQPYSVEEIDALREHISPSPKHKNIHIPPPLQGLFEQLQELVFFRTERTDVFYCLMFLARPILKEMGKKHNIPFEEMKYYRALSFLSENPEKYSEKVSFGYFKGEACFQETPILTHSYVAKDNTDITGTIAFQGKIQGYVKVITHTSELHKIQNGDILVTQMTFPSFVSAMHRASAFVTDEGGITCHAAIVAREMKKPCIIGTKYATQILKDGDFVEVDAEKGVVKILEKKKDIFQENWEVGATRNMPLWHDILCLYGWEDNMIDYGVTESVKVLFAIKNATHATMFMLPDNQKKSFTVIAQCCQDGQAVKNLRKKYEEYAKEVQSHLKDLIQQQDTGNWENFFRSYQRFTAGLWVTTGFGRIGTEQLEQKLSESHVQKEKIPEIMSILTYPKEHTPLFLSQRDMLIIGEKIQKNKKIDTEKELQKWLEDYQYIPVNFCEDPWTMKDAEEHLKDILQQDCEKTLQELELHHQKKIESRKKLGKQYSVDIRNISDALAETTSLNEYRKNIFCRLSYSIRFVFKVIAQKIGSTDWRDVYYCTPEEILKIVSGDIIDIQKIKKEREKCVFVREGEKITWGDEAEVQKFFDKIYNKNDVLGEKITGFSANKGKITGRVKVVLSTKDFHKVNRGDILVTTMTSVDFVPIMEKAGAFVTNEGGITTHAAIVAREMNKPCIIGTKHATKVLKDGDFVEVDAEKGVVRLLNNNQIISHTSGEQYEKFIHEIKNISWHYWLNRPYTVFIATLLWPGNRKSVFARNGFGGIDSDYYLYQYPGIYYESRFSESAFKFISTYFTNHTVSDISQKLHTLHEDNISQLTSIIGNSTKNVYEKLMLISDLAQNYVPYLQIIISLEEYFNHRINTELPLYFDDNFSKIVGDMSVPIKQNAYTKMLDEIRKGVSSKLIVEKYGWMKSRDGFSDFYNEEDINNIREHLKIPHLTKSNIPAGLLSLQGELQELSFLRTDRTDKMYEFFGLARPFFEEIAKSINITFSELANYDACSIAQRVPKSYSNNFTYALLGDEYFISDTQIVNFSMDSSGEIRGQKAFLGKVSGHVKIVTHSNDIAKVEIGDILVSQMTFPSFISAMQKSAAFITDEGSITCHAAIIAREMKKPCIIGTKHATKVLKDGDFVEVDADNGVVKILGKNRETGWVFTYDRQMSYQRIELFHEGYCHGLSDYFDVKIENELYRIKDGLVSVFYDENGHNEAFAKIRSLLTGGDAKNWYKKIYTTITRDYKKFISFLNEGEDKTYENIGEGLQEYMNQNRDISLSTWLLYAYVEEILSETLQHFLQKKGIKNWQEILNILSQPDEIIPIDSWEYDTAQAALLGTTNNEEITKLYMKYKSYGMYDVMFQGKSEKEINEKIQEQRPIAKEVIKKIDKKYEQQKKALKKVYSFQWNETEEALIRIYRLYVNFKDWKNFHRERSSYQIQNIYKNIATKQNKKVTSLWYMTTDEIFQGIQNNDWIEEDEIEKRRTNSALIFQGKNMDNVTDTADLIGLDDNLFLEKNMIKGEVVYPGNITGKARIIYSQKDLKKLSKGEIMIASTTRPDYLPFMKDIAGFITNEGGMLSHAAILAREIKKPCIIGTKIATQVIKTGDKISLNTETGIIQIEKSDNN